jgi:hypothetical protein
MRALASQLVDPFRSGLPRFRLASGALEKRTQPNVQFLS